jgi:hypothetical protein
MTDTAATTEYRAELTPTNVLTRWTCAICEGHTAKDEFIAVFSDEDGSQHVVCDECLRAGADAVPDRLLERASGMEGEAVFLRERAPSSRWMLPFPGVFDRAAWLESAAAFLREAAKSRWVLPSYDEWRWANEYRATNE